MAKFERETRPVCPECGKRISLKKDGTLRHHLGCTPEYVGSRFMKRCPGSDGKPIE